MLRLDVNRKSKVIQDEIKIPIAFHRFPAKEDLRNQSIKSVKSWKWNHTRYSFICSEHFLISDYKVPPWEPRPRLHPKSIPSVFQKFPKHLQEKPPKERKTINSTPTSSSTQKQNLSKIWKREKNMGDYLHVSLSFPSRFLHGWYT